MLQVLDFSNLATGIYVTEDIIIGAANSALLRFWNKDKSVIGKKLEDAVPELAGQPFIDILKTVWRTGVSYEATEAAAYFLVDGEMRTSYFDFEYKAVKKDTGEMWCILNTATDVTERVKSRELLERAQEQEAALEREKSLNEEMAALNEELSATIEELYATQQKLYTLNEELEARVLGRTKALAISEENFRSMIMQAPVAMGFFRGEEMKLEIINDAFLQLWGRSREIVGKPLLEALPELKAQPYHQIMQTVLHTGETYYGTEEKVLLYRNGRAEEGYYNFINHPYQNAEGKNAGVIVVAMEVTGQVLAQQKQQALNEELVAANEELSSINEEMSLMQRYLEESESRLTRFFMQAPAGICVLDGEDLVFELVNPSYQQLFPGRELLGKPVWEALPEIKGQPVEAILQSVYRTGKPFEGNGLLVPLARTTDGPVEDRYFNFTYQARRDENDETDGILVFVYEVTEQVLAAKRVEQAEVQLQTAITAANIGTWTLDLGTGAFRASDRMKEIYGFPPGEEISIEQAVGQIPEEQRMTTEAAIEHTLQTGETYQMEHSIVGFHDGQTRWVQAVGNVSKDSQGKVAYFNGVSIDITEQKKEQQLKNDFIAIASHELKTPLTTLKAYVQMIKLVADKNKDVYTSATLGKVENQINRMTTMIHGFLNVSRLEAGKIQIDKTRFDMAALMKDAEEETASLYNTHRIVFQPLEEAYVYADREKIAHVINNFISNAVKYSPDNTLIHIACVTVDNSVQISVQDEGIGIRKQDGEKIFDRYYRVEDRTTKSISGFGIGLYLSAEIIRRHDGKIWVDSEVGKGSTFFFTLPIEKK